MNLLFAHDVKLLKDNNTMTYFSESYNYKLWQRYLEVFDEIIVASRAIDLPEEVTRDPNKVSNGPHVTFHTIPSISGYGNMLRNRAEARSRLRQAIQSTDVLLARLPSEIGSLAVSVACELKKPWILELVGDPWDSLWNYGNWQGKVYAPVSKIKTKKIVEQSPYTLYVTKDFLQKKYPSKGVCYSCSDVFLDTTVDAGNLSNKILNKDNYIIGLVGTMSANYKGIDTALYALDRVKREGIHFEFRVLGGGNPQQFKELAEKLNLSHDVVFSGTLPSGPLVYKWLDELDLYLQPSRTEGLPRSLVEAMSRGLPTIATNVGGIPELLTPDCMIKPNDSSNLARLIIQFLNNRDLRLEKAIRNTEMAREYTLENLQIKRTSFFQQVRDYVTRL